MTTERLALAELKANSPKDLLNMAEELEIENASTMRKGEMMFQILRERADEGWEVIWRWRFRSITGWIWLSSLSRSELPTWS